MKKLLVIILAYSSIGSFAQTMPTPDVTGMVEGASVPVDLFSGSATIGVPLYTIEHNNGAQVPIALQYKTRPFKVAEIPASTGLGWDLIAGGAITRIMKDRPDESGLKGRLNFDTNEGSGDIWAKHINDDYVNSADFENDVFYFSYPGSSGKFILKEILESNGDYSFEAITLPQSDLKIDVDFNFASKSLNSFTIFDLAGNKYVYGTGAYTLEQSTSTSTSDGEIKNQSSFTSTWKLNSIVFANQPASQAIHFSYSPSPQLSTSYTTASAAFTNYGTPGHFYFLSETTSNHNTSILPTKLERINFSKGYVQFNYGGRDDLLDGVSLTTVEVFDHLDNLVHFVELDYNYSNAGNSTLMSFSSSGTVSKRLTLKSVHINGYMFREFEYLNELDSDYELPPRNSNRVDADGLFHDNRPEELLPYDLDGANRFTGGFSIPNGQSNYAKANMLRNIIFQSGGRTEIIYNTALANGNVTIDEIRNLDENGGLVSGNSYSYSGPQDSQYDYLNQDYRIDHTDIFFLNSHAVSKIQDLVPRGYSTVEVTDLKTNQMVRTQFYNWIPENGFFDTPNEVSSGTNGSNSYSGPYQVVIWNQGIGNYGVINGPRKYIAKITWDGNLSEATESSVYPRFANPPASSRPLIDYRIGLPSVVTTIDADGKKITQMEYHYEHSSSEQLIMNRVIQKPIIEGEPFTANVGNKFASRLWYKLYVSEYAISSKFLYLDHTISTTFDASEDELKKVRADYSYHPDYPSLIKEVHTYSLITDSEAFGTKSYTYYPSDYDAIDVSMRLDTKYNFSSAVLDNMVSKNMIGIPLATRQDISLPAYQSTDHPYRTNRLGFTVFKEFNGRTYPHKTYRYNFPQPYTFGANGYLTEVIDQGPDLLSTTTYDDNGLLSTQIGLNGVTTTYTYDDQGYLISKTVNPSITTNTSETPLTFTTSYTYKPLVGIESITDPNGQTITYEYDSRNRLTLTRDHNHNIIERKLYNSASDPNEIVLNLTIDGSFTVGEKMVFNLNESSLGQNKYYWSFGDGRFLETEKSTVDHVYTEPRRTHLEVAVFNENYKNKLVQTQVDFNITDQVRLRAELMENNCETWTEFTLINLPFCSSSSEVIWQIQNEDGWIDIQSGGISYTYSGRDSGNQAYFRVFIPLCSTEYGNIYSNEQYGGYANDSGCEQDYEEGN